MSRIAGILAGAFLVLWLSASAAGAFTVPSWGAPKEVLGPPNRLALPAASIESSVTGLSAVSCAEAGDCTAVGTYELASYQTAAMAAEEIGGAWQEATELPDPSGHQPELNGVSCYAPNECVAVGEDGDDAIGYSDVDGKWSDPSTVKLPSNANAQPDAYLESVSCAHSQCEAIGTYDDKNGDVLSTSAVDTSGSWTAQEIAPPTGDFTLLSSISCVGLAGDCTAVGSASPLAGGGQVPVIYTETNGVWSTPYLPSFPASASNPGLTAVSCTALGDCTAVGYLVNSGGGGLLAYTETNGSWGSAQAPSFPQSDMELTSISCTSPGDCTSAGAYSDDTGNVEPLYAIQLNGSWNGSQALGLPSNASTSGDSQRSDLTSISCPQAGDCTTVGDYNDAVGPGDEHFVGITSTAANVPALAVATHSLPAAHLGAVYRATLAGTGGTAHYTWSVMSGSLPAGLSLNPATGAITGTPIRTGTSHFTVGVSDPGLPVQSSSAAVSLKVDGLRVTHYTFHNQRISLGMPDGCFALSSPLIVGFDSKAIRHSHAARLKFSSAAFSFTLGKRHPTFVVRRVSFIERFTFTLKPTSRRMKLVLTYREHHKRMRKTLHPRFAICSG